MKKVILTILDGYGISSKLNGNAVKLANTKTLDKIFNEYPNTVLSASGIDVGLPLDQMGNSEVGHMNIGAGRIVYQDLTRINKDILDGTFFKNETLIKTVLYAKENNQKLHLMGLLSDGGVHSHINHLFSILDMCSKLNFHDVYVHAILDGRDTKPTNGINYLESLIKKLEELNLPTIATVIGRFYTMDRDSRYERVEVGYKLMTDGIGLFTKDLLATIKEKYYNKVLDEFMEPILVNKDGLICKEDAVIFFNYRPDRAREITRAFIDKEFYGFKTKNLNLYFTSMKEYDVTLKTNIIYKKDDLKNTIGEVIASNNLKQLRIAETEKYAHVTFFLNGGVEEKFNLENRILVPSPKDVKTYDLKPEMSAYLVKDKVISAMDENKYDLIVLNFANPDMVGHTGNLEATIKALEAVDDCMKEILESVIKNNYVLITTADHGNAESMINSDGSINTAHTNNLVPFSIVNYINVNLRKGILADISPTILDILELEKPSEMLGESLIIK